MREPIAPGGPDMPLSGHLTELRKRLLRVAVPMLLLLPAALGLAPRLLDVLFLPLERLHCAVYKYGVMDGLTLTIRAALLMETTAFAPLIAWEAACFLWPGLYPGERRRVLLAALAGGGLFILGVAAYLLYAVNPLTALWYKNATVFAPQLSATECYGLQLTCMLACGLIAAGPSVIIPWILFAREKKKEGRK